ncbi:hypothetical protein GCM10022243_59840 [Saccharothrix violaceirubra]
MAIAAIAGLVLLGVRGCGAYLRAEAVTVIRYLHALGAGDTATVCDLVVEEARVKLLRLARADSCEEAAARLTAALAPEVRAELLRDDPGIYSIVVSGDRTEISLGAGPFDVHDFVLYERDGREKITDWGFEARRLS